MIARAEQPASLLCGSVCKEGLERGQYCCLALGGFPGTHPVSSHFTHFPYVTGTLPAVVLVLHPRILFIFNQNTTVMSSKSRVVGQVGLFHQLTWVGFLFHQAHPRNLQTKSKVCVEGTRGEATGSNQAPFGALQARWDGCLVHQLLSLLGRDGSDVSISIYNVCGGLCGLPTQHV